MKLVVAVVLCFAALGQINTASAQQFYWPGYYYYGTGADLCCVLTTIDLGWAYTRNQPAGEVRPYPPLRMADGTLACSHSNYRPIRGWCRRIW